MFYTLHRLVKLCAWVVVALVIVWLYRQREALEPIYSWYDVYHNGGLRKTEPLPTIQGNATQITDGHTFQLESDKHFYLVRLTGFAPPEPPLSAGELERESKRREALKQLVLLKPVTVDVTYSNLNSLLGIVHVEGTNVNLYYLTNGLSPFKAEFVKTAPRNVQYQFFSAALWREKKLHEKVPEMAQQSE